jgi:Zn-dependent peptidase ImmA (M78 family)
MADFNYSRVDLARRRRGLTKSKLATDSGLSTRMLRKYEQGSEPTPATIERLATVLGFPVTFFYGDTLDEPNPDGVSFRALSSLSVTKSQQALASSTLALALANWIDERFELPMPDVPDYRGSDPVTAAEALRERWGLGERPVANMVHLLESRGIRVFSLAEEYAEVDAFSFWRDACPYVFLNTMKTVERSRMDAAHELGHLVLHGHGGPTGRQAEHEAQAFGSAFLMPESSVVARISRGATLTQLIEAKSFWKVAAFNLVHRAHGLELISEWQYRSMCIALSKRGRANEPRQMRTSETSQVLSKVFRALRAENVDRGDVAADLHIPADELSKSVFGYMLRSIDGGSQAPDAVEAPQERPSLRVV